MLTQRYRHQTKAAVDPVAIPRSLGGDLLSRAEFARATHLDELAARWRTELSGEDLPRRIAETEIEAFALRVAHLQGEIEALGGSPSPAHPSARRTAAAAMAAFVSEHAGEDIAVAHVAAHVHLNAQYAMSIFRAALGITIGDYLAQCRVVAAQQLLLTTDLPISEVGFAAGFSSLSQFYDRFARWCGQSPGAYRRRLRAP